MTRPDAAAHSRRNLAPVSAEGWRLLPEVNLRLIGILLACTVLLTLSARRNELYRLPGMVIEGISSAVGLTGRSEEGESIRRLAAGLFPLSFSEKTDVVGVEHFDRKRLPLWTHLTREPIRQYSALDNRWRVIDTRLYLVDPIGYLKHDLVLMLETIEVAIWGTLAALVFAMPLAHFGARGFTPNRLTYSLARGLCSFTRALPELVSALFFVMIFGLGVIPGVVTLAFSTLGFLGKFLADDIENADKGPQEALRSLGANRLKVLRFAVLPQSMPQIMAYIQYILERNVRAATAIGVVGAGGIGMELKGRWDMYDYAHVSTSLLVIFLTVILLERGSQFIRSKLIGS